MVWPTSLPAPRSDGYGLTPVDPVIRTDMESGAPRARRRSAARNDRISVMWVFTDTQMATFRTWFDDAAEAAGGSNWFYLNVAIGTSGIVSMQCRFAGIWQARQISGWNWEVSATLEVR